MEQDADLPQLQREVQRLLGRCLLRLQQYERLLKAMVAHQQLAGPATELAALHAKQVASVANQTLGQLMNQLLGNYLVIEGTEREAPDITLENVTFMNMTVHLSLSAPDYQRIQEDLKELVRLRNTLVHHFLEQHDLWSLSGCQEAYDVLNHANERVDRHLEQLQDWAERLDQIRTSLANFINSETGYDLLVDGIAPDGKVYWSYAGCVQALLAAAKALAVNGWTSVAAAERWIAQQHPEQLPRRYGCASWRQVIHESRLFDLSYREGIGQRQACYRSKSGPSV